MINTEGNLNIKQDLADTLRPLNISCIPFFSRGMSQQQRRFAQETYVTAASEGQIRTRGKLRLPQRAT